MYVKSSECEPPSYSSKGRMEGAISEIRRLPVEDVGATDSVATVTSVAAKPVKRRRQRACDGCRQRKIRCDDSPGPCRNCETYRIDCIISRVDDGTDITRGIHVPKAQENSQEITLRRAKRKLPNTSGNSDNAARRTYPVRSPADDQNSGSFTQITGPSNAHNCQPSPQNNASISSPAQGSTRGSKPEVVEGVVVIESGRLPKKSKFAGMSSGHVLAKSAEELFKDYANGIDVMKFFCPLTRFSEEISMKPMSFYPLIDKQRADYFLNAYFSTIHMIFPVLEEQSTREFYETFYRDGQTNDASRACCIYLAIALGETGQNEEEIRSAHFTATWNLYERLMADPYLPSVQALILLTLELMSSHKDGQALLTIGSATRIAQSIGLHRKLDAHKHPHEMQFVRKDYGLRSCVWWACYCLDKKLCFEGGRPSMIKDEDCDVDLPTSETTLASPPSVPLENGLSIFPYFISLCKVLSLISSQLFSAAIVERDEEALLLRVVNVDKNLLNWKRDLPEELQPDSELASIETEPALYGVGLLHCMYHNAMLVTHRAALLGNVTTEMNAQSNPRIAAAETVCLKAAGSLARSVNDFVYATSNQSMIRWVTPYILNTLFTLYIGIMKAPLRWSYATDLALMTSMADCLSRTQINPSIFDSFAELLNSLCSAIEMAKESHSRLQGQSSMSTQNFQRQRVSIPAQVASELAEGQVYGSMDAIDNIVGSNGTVGAGRNGLENTDFQFQDFFGDGFGSLNMQLWPTNAFDFGQPHRQMSFDMNI